jgi:hypothetical protein
VAAVALAAAAVAGCDRSEQEGPMTGGTESSVSGGASASAGAAGEAALAESGARLQDIVRGIVDPVPGIDKTYDTGLSRSSCKDVVGDDPWPQQETFHADVFVRGDSRPAGRQVVDRLRTEGWSIEDVGRLTGQQTQHWTARRDGYVVTIGSTAADVAALAVGGSTPCVAADGTVSDPGR